MSLYSDFMALRKKQEEEEAKKGKQTTSSKTGSVAPVKTTTKATGGSSLLNEFLTIREAEENIAPVRERVNARKTVNKKKKDEDERKWFQKGAFEDGYDFGDITKTILGSGADLVENVGTGVIGMGEKIVDAFATIAPYAANAQFLQNGGYYNLELQKQHDKALEESKKELSKFVAKDLYDEEKVAKKIVDGITFGYDYEGDSVFGEKTDSVIQSGGQLLATIGLQAAGVPWFLTTGATAFGGEAENALNEGATFEEAALSSTISAGAEILTEKISGGIKFGGKALDDVLTQQIARGISNKFVRNAAKLGLDAFGEGAEEWITEDINKFGQWLTYRDEEELKELLFSEEAMDEKIEAFIGGALLGGVSNVGKTVKSKIDGVDSVTGFTKNEEAVVDKVYKELLAEAGENGKVTAREKTKIYDRVIRELEKGGISTDTIESLLDEEGYNAFNAEKDNFFKSDIKKSYDDALKSEEEQLKELQKKLDELADAPNTVGNNRLYDSVVNQMTELQNNPGSAAIKSQLDQEVKRINELKNQLRTKVHDMVKGTKLEESYNELIRSQQKYEVDVSKYTDSNAKKTIENILKSGMGDNSNHFHEYADWLAQISADKGMSFSLTNNEALKGTEHDFSKEGLTTNGFKTADGITLNMDSPKALNSTVGHEITHVLEQNTELYQTLQESVFNYEIAKNGQESFDKRLKAIEASYKGKDADAKAELTADLIGDYLFTDYDFVHNLSTENRNVFQKIYDEIKYLCKVVTAGSKEARELEKVKKVFEDAYRANVKGKGDTTKYALENGNNRKYNKHSRYNETETLFMRWENGSAPVGEVKKFVRYGKTHYYEKTENGCVELSRSQYNERYGVYVEKDYRRAESEISEAANYDESTQRGIVGYHDSNRYTAGTATVFGQAFAEELSNDTSGSVSSTPGYSNRNNLNQSEYSDEASDESGASFVTFSNDYAFYRNYMKEGDKGSKYSLSELTFDDIEKMSDEELEKAFNELNLADYLELEISDSDLLDYDFSIDSISKEIEVEPEIIKILYRRNGLGNSHVEDNHKAVMTQDRIKQRIAEHGAPHIDDYARRYITRISPKDFIDMTVLEKNMDRDNFDNRVRGDYDGKMGDWDYEKQLRDSEEPPVLIINKATGQIIGHNGRHRMRALEMAGIESVEIEVELHDEDGYLIKYNSQTIPDMAISSQFDTSIETHISNVIPLNNAHLGEIGKHYGEKAHSNAAVKYSLSDTNGREVSPAVANRFGNSKAVDENGSLKVLYHGTASGEFSIFDKTKGSVEGDFGSGFYFTDDAYDVENNYEGGGPDFDNKVGRRADEIWGEEDDIEYEEAERRAREELYKGSHLFEVYLNIENPAIVGETILLDPDSYYSQYDQEDYDSEDDYLADVEQFIADEIDNIIWEVERNVDVNSTDGIADVLWGAFNEGGVDPELLKKRLNQLYLEDSNGNLVANEVARQIIESLGYDGIIDPTVSTKWNMNMNPGTTHYIVFKPNQIKSVTNENPTDNPDIHRSLSNNGVKPKQYGDWNVYGSDFGAKNDSFAPVIPTPNRNVLPGEKHSVAEMFPDEPDVSQAEYDNLVEVKESLESWMQELSGADLDNPELFSEFEQVNEKLVEVYNRLLELDSELSDSDRVDSLSDADAPPEMDAPYYESDPTNLTKKATADIVREVRTSLSLNNQQIADAKDIIERYRTGKIQTREQLVDALQEKFGTYTDTVVDERLAELKREIRTRRLNVSDTIKYGIADYASVMRSNRGKILFAKNGLDVDSFYKELQESFPDYFNEDEQLNPENMFRQIVDIANTPHVEEIHRNKDIENIEEAADLIINGIGNFKWNQNLAQSNKESKQAFESLMRQADRYAPMDDIAPVKPVVPVAKKSSVAPKTVKPETQQNGRVAQVHTVEPKSEKRKSKVWSWAKEHLLDNGMVFEDLSKKTGNRRLEAKWNFIRNSGARAQRLIGKGANGVKSLTDIRKEVEKSGKTDKFFTYLYHVHNIDRMTLADRFEGTPNKAVFGDTVTADISKQEASRMLKQNPEFKQWSQDIYKFNKHLRNLLVDGGVISQEVANLWEKMYPHYVPIRRAGDTGLNINVPLDSKKTGVNAPIKRATGGSRDILPLFDTMAMRAEQTYRAIAKNNFGVELKNMLGSTISNEAQTVDGVIDSLDSDEALLKKGENGMNPTFAVFENGERVEFEITEEMYEAMKPKSDMASYNNKVLNGISNFRRGTLTEYNPWFLLKNAIKDQQDIIINSQHPVKTYANMPVAIGEMVAGGEYYQEYLENGGEQNTYFDTESNTFDENKAWEAVKWATGLNEIAWANNKIEMLPRLAEYIASRKAGRSVEVSMLDAARVTTNFAAGGDVTKVFNRNGATFLNASVQGAIQQARNIREAKMNGLKGWAGLAARYLVAGLPVVLLNNLIWEDDEEYEELADYVKRDYYIVGKFDDGKFVRIPKGRTVAVLQNAFEQMDNLRTGDDDVDLKAFLELAVSNLAPNNPLDNNILSPIIQVLNNKTWYGEDLVPSRLEDVPKEEQYDESTDDISRWLGEKTGTSPIKWNYLIDQYSGVIGDTFLPMLTPEAESGDDSTFGTMTAPLRDMFTTDSVINNQISGDFYDTKDLVDIAANSSKATDEDKMKSTYMQAVSWELSDLYAQKREIQNSDMADSAKYKQSRDIQKQINEIMEDAMGGYENVSINGLYSEVGNKRFNHDAESGKWYEIKPKNSDGSDNWYYQMEQDVTKALGLSYGEYWNNREEYNYAYEKPEQYTLAKAVGGYQSFRSYTSDLYDIKADKDANGKSINGSRKTKVIDYVNNLDADYGEKLVLFKSEYPADDSHNYEIVEYLCSREDISYDEMVTILKYLDFKVDSNGYVTW